MHIRLLTYCLCTLSRLSRFYTTIWLHYIAWPENKPVSLFNVDKLDEKHNQIDYNRLLNQIYMINGPCQAEKRQKKMSFHPEWYFKVKMKFSINKIIATVAF